MSPLSSVPTWLTLSPRAAHRKETCPAVRIVYTGYCDAISTWLDGADDVPCAQEPAGILLRIRHGRGQSATVILMCEAINNFVVFVVLVTESTPDGRARRDGVYRTMINLDKVRRACEARALRLYTPLTNAQLYLAIPISANLAARVPRVFQRIYLDRRVTPGVDPPPRETVVTPTSLPVMGVRYLHG